MRLRLIARLKAVMRARHTGDRFYKSRPLRHQAALCSHSAVGGRKPRRSIPHGPGADPRQPLGEPTHQTHILRKSAKISQKGPQFDEFKGHHRIGPRPECVPARAKGQVKERSRPSRTGWPHPTVVPAVSGSGDSIRAGRPLPHCRCRRLPTSTGGDIPAARREAHPGPAPYSGWWGRQNGGTRPPRALW